MKRIFSIALLLLISSFKHDVKLAIFEIYEQEEKLNLFVRIDREDLETAIGVQLNEIVGKGEDTEALQVILQTYFDENIQWDFDGKKVETQIFDISFPDKYYVNVESVLFDIKPKIIQKIKVTNTCLLKEIEGQSNVIKSHLYGKVRGFRLHQDRTSTTIDYSEYLKKD